MGCLLCDFLSVNASLTDQGAALLSSGWGRLHLGALAVEMELAIAWRALLQEGFDPFNAIGMVKVFDEMIAFAHQLLTDGV